MSFPIIDISHISDPSSYPLIAEKVTTACKEWGFLMIRGHQISSPDLKEMFALSKAFFQLSEDDKEKYPINSEHIGYIGSFEDRSKDDKMSMWFSGAPGYLEANKSMLPPFWHPHTQKLDTFKHQCHDLLIQLLKCFALALGLPDINFFADAHKENVADGDRLRMLMYPAREESLLGVGEDVGITRMVTHTDSNSMTLVFQTSPGLEVLSPDGSTWTKAPYFEDCILVNLGDTLSFWSGGQLKSTLHRVTYGTVPQQKERQSIAYFGSANPATVLKPIVSDSTSIEKFRFNGEEVRDGITVGELQTMIMRNIYGDYIARKSA